MLDWPYKKQGLHGKEKIAKTETTVQPDIQLFRDNSQERTQETGPQGSRKVP
jgi:hypothetical protein